MSASNWKLVANTHEAKTFSQICQANALPYSHGCGCYELVKAEKVSASKFLVAMNEDTGEIVEGDTVRARLGLKSGDATIGKKDVPSPWTLYVNSTSPNRAVPANTTVLIRLGPASGAVQKHTCVDAAELLGDDDDDIEDKKELQRFAASYFKLAAAARSKFLSSTLAFFAPRHLPGTEADASPQEKAKNTMGRWIVRAAKEIDFDEWDSCRDWPQAFVGGERQPIVAAFWTDEAVPVLTGIFVFSPTGDETNLYYTKDFDDFAFVSGLDHAPAIVADAFSVSSGDQAANHFYCPALQEATLEELTQGAFATMTAVGTTASASVPVGAPPAEPSVASKSPNSEWKLVANTHEAKTFSQICQANALPYSHGCGCYELVKAEKVSASKFLVAMNEDTGEIVEGDTVRARLGLKSGDATIGKKDVPSPWTLYVNSTSPNRAVPANTTVLIRLGPAAKKLTPAELFVQSALDPELSSNAAFREFAANYCPTAEKALKRFLKFSQVFEIDGDPGTGNKFVARGVRVSLIGDTFNSYEWPWAFVGGIPQPVFGAVWCKRELTLLAVFTVDHTCDESSVYYLGEKFNESDRCVLEDLQEGGGGCYADAMAWEEDVSDSFTVSRGEFSVDSLYCPALERVSQSMLLRTTKRPLEE